MIIDKIISRPLQVIADGSNTIYSDTKYDFQLHLVQHKTEIQRIYTNHITGGKIVLTRLKSYLFQMNERNILLMATRPLVMVVYHRYGCVSQVHNYHK